MGTVNGAPIMIYLLFMMVLFLSAEDKVSLRKLDATIQIEKRADCFVEPLTGKALSRVQQALHLQSLQLSMQHCEEKLRLGLLDDKGTPIRIEEGLERPVLRQRKRLLAQFKKLLLKEGFKEEANGFYRFQREVR